MLVKLPSRQRSYSAIAFTSGRFLPVRVQIIPTARHGQTKTHLHPVFAGG
jgi:hypothetical protein